MQAVADDITRIAMTVHRSLRGEGSKRMVKPLTE